MAEAITACNPLGIKATHAYLLGQGHQQGILVEAKAPIRCPVVGNPAVRLATSPERHPQIALKPFQAQLGGQPGQTRQIGAHQGSVGPVEPLEEGAIEGDGLHPLASPLGQVALRGQLQSRSTLVQKMDADRLAGTKFQDATHHRGQHFRKVLLAAGQGGQIEKGR
jgi:hypothetical protein